MPLAWWRSWAHQHKMDRETRLGDWRLERQRIPAEQDTGVLTAEIERRAVERAGGVGGHFWQISPDLLGVLKADGYFERANPAWQTVLGWSEAEVRQMSIFELLHPDDRERTRQGFEHLKRGNPILRFENRYRRKDGGYNWFAWAAAPLGDAYYCSGRDVTFEKEQAAELAARTIERDRVWQNARDLLVIIGADGIYRAANPAWTEILGYEPEEIVGRSFREFVWPEDAELTQIGLDTAASKNNLSTNAPKTVSGTKTARRAGFPGTPPSRAISFTATGATSAYGRSRQQPLRKPKTCSGSRRKWRH